MTFPYGQMLPVLRRTTARDRYGDGGYFEEHHQIGPCGVSYGNAGEFTDNREATSTDAQVIAPLGSDVLASDQVELPDGPYRVVGRPEPYGRHPMTGSTELSGLVIRLNRVA